MKYLCLVYGEEKTLDTMSSSQMQTCVDESMAYDEVLRNSGHLIAAHALKPVAAATTVRMCNGETLTTDGPFAETKEQLLGFILIDARDRDDALQVASKIPLARVGCIEVRPIAALSG